MEEVAIELRPLKPLTPVHHDYPHGQVTLFPFLCEHQRGEPQLLEVQKAIWVKRSELGNYEFPAGNRTLLDEVRLEMRTRIVLRIPEADALVRMQIGSHPTPVSRGTPKTRIPPSAAANIKPNPNYASLRSSPLARYSCNG